MSQDKLQEENILLTQIDALDQNLHRIDELLRNEAIEAQYRNAIYGKFAQTLSPPLRGLDTLRKSVEGKDLTQAQLARAWEDYTTLKQEGQKVFAQCLDFLGGIAVRKMGLEEGMCNLAEGLVRYYAGETGLPWSSLMIVGEERLFDTVAQITQIIRLRFPEWDLWTLPFTAHEFGQLVASTTTVGELQEFFVDEKRLTRQLIEEENLGAQVLQGVAPNILALREKYVGSKDTAEVKDFLEQQQIYMRSLFADMFGTYFLGPAYLYARLYLRLVPTEATLDGPYKPSMHRRMAFMLGTLKEMNEAERPSRYDPGPFDGELKRFETVWTETVQAVVPGYAGDFQFGKPYDDWFPKAHSALRTRYSLVGFRGERWKAAQRIGDQLFDSPQVGPATSLVTLLNAAWYCRSRHPGKSREIEKKIRTLCDQVVSQPPAGGPPRPPSQR